MIQAHPNNYGGSRQPNTIKYIVIHYTGNDGDSANGNANYFKGDRGVSAHYFVDNTSIIQTVPDLRIAWSVGGKKYPNASSTGGGTFHGKCTNANSISIELCDSVKNGKYDFTENTLKQAAELAGELMTKYNVPLSNVIRHFDVTGKVCPLPMVNDPRQWKAFKERLVQPRVQEEVIDVNGTPQKMKTVMQNGLTYVQLRKLSDLLGFEIGWNSAKKVGLIQGHELDTVLVDDTGYCQLREIASIIGKEVTYDPKTKAKGIR